MKKKEQVSFWLLMACSLILSSVSIWWVFSHRTTAEEKETLVIFHAGSLSLPLKAAADSFRVLHPEVEFQMEAAGSIDCARKITELGRSCDILASADYSVIDKLLIPEYADENIPFAGNELSIVFTPESRYASEINSENWYRILAKKDVFFGRSDPDADPCGYRTLLMFKLARKYYGPGCDIESVMLSKDTRFIRPKEVDLISLLEANAIDYIFIYKSIAVQHGLKYVQLPDEINLSRADMAEIYSQASVRVRGKKPGETVTMTGTPMTYSLTIPKCSENPETARLFVEYLLSPEGGQKILKEMGQSPL